MSTLIDTNSQKSVFSKHYLLKKKKRIPFLRDFQGILSMKRPETKIQELSKDGYVTSGT